MIEKEEVSIKDILLNINEFKNELFLKKYKISVFSILFVCAILFVISSKEKTYTAELTFVVEEENVASPLSSMSGIASQFGFDVFGGGTSTFSQQNIMQLLKSRGVISKTLLEDITINNQKDYIIEHYISLYEKKSLWINSDLNNLGLSFSSALTQAHDSIISLAWEEIVEQSLHVDIKNDETNIISLSFTSSNENFSKLFAEKLISQMSMMYVEYKTKQASNTIDFLQSRSDSVFSELEGSEREYARIKDINQRIIKASGRLKELQLMRNVEVLNTMYLEIIKNLEIAKMTLLNQTPIIQIIDRPILPLKDNSVSKLLVVIISIFISLILSIIYLFFVKLFRDSLR